VAARAVARELTVRTLEGETGLFRMVEVVAVDRQQIGVATAVLCMTHRAVVRGDLAVHALSRRYPRFDLVVTYEAPGTVDVEVGDLISGPCPGFIPDVCMEANEKLLPEQRRKQLGSDRFRLFGYPGWELIEEQMRNRWGERHSAAVNLHSPAHAPTAFRAMLTGKPYPVKSLLVSCSNPLLSYANTKLVYRALLATDLLVTLDITWTPTAALSDYVLPAACWMERADMGNFASVGGYPLVQVGEAAVPARVPGEYERLNDYSF